MQEVREFGRWCLDERHGAGLSVPCVHGDWQGREWWTSPIVSAETHEDFADVTTRNNVYRVYYNQHDDTEPDRHLLERLGLSTKIPSTALPAEIWLRFNSGGAEVRGCDGELKQDGRFVLSYYGVGFASCLELNDIFYLFGGYGVRINVITTERPAAIITNAGIYVIPPGSETSLDDEDFLVYKRGCR